MESYPVDKPERSHDDFMFFGSRSLYERAGFTEVARRSPTRLVMRLVLAGASPDYQPEDSMPQDPSASVIVSDAEPGTEPLAWPEVRQRFDAERWYWVATTGRDARPHLRPVLAVWLHDKVYSTTSPGARKGRDLQVHPECSMAARAPAIDIVVEGATSWVDDRTLLEQVAAAYDRKYGWPVTITEENMFDAPYGAPTAGPPPYRVYEITPRFVYAFGTGDSLGVRSTRFRLPLDEAG